MLQTYLSISYILNYYTQLNQTSRVSRAIRFALSYLLLL